MVTNAPEASMTIDRRQIFTLAWKSAKGTAAGYPSLRAAFAAALRRVWSLVKAMVAEEGRCAGARHQQVSVGRRPLTKPAGRRPRAKDLGASLTGTVIRQVSHHRIGYTILAAPTTPPTAPPSSSAPAVCRSHAWRGPSPWPRSRPPFLPKPPWLRPATERGTRGRRCRPC